MSERKGLFPYKENDPLIFTQIKEALKIGYEDYKGKGWI